MLWEMQVPDMALGDREQPVASGDRLSGEATEDRSLNRVLRETSVWMGASPTGRTCHGRPRLLMLSRQNIFFPDEAFIQYVTELLVNKELLFRRAKLNMPPRRIIWDRNKQNNIIQQLYDESGHRGKKGTYEKIALHYWWKGLYCDVKKCVITCESW